MYGNQFQDKWGRNSQRETVPQKKKTWETIKTKTNSQSFLAKWQTAPEGYHLSSIDSSSFIFCLFQACFIGQSLRANWLAEPLSHTVHPRSAVILLLPTHTARLPPQWEGAWQLQEKTGAATASPGTRQEMECNHASVKAAKNTHHCHFKQREEVATDGMEDRVRKMMRISWI